MALLSRPARAEPLLTDREQEVLQAVARGLSNQAIANELSIGINTVRSHIRNPDTRKQILGDLWRVAGADGQISPEEQRFIMEIVDRFGTLA